jgi:DNA polymerase-1
VSEIIWNELKLQKAPKEHWDRVKGRVQLAPNSTADLAVQHLGSYDDFGKKIRDGHPFVDELLAYRRVHKIDSTYVKNLLETSQYDGFAHFDIKVHGTETGRLSTFLHTIPRESSDKYGAMIRTSIKAPEGMVIIVADFSQAEFRGWAAVSNDPFLISVYEDPDGDMHRKVVEAQFGTEEELGKKAYKEARVIIKRFNFAYIYGGNVASQQSDAALDQSKSKAMAQWYDENLQVANQWKRDQEKLMHRQGYVTSPFNRRRRFPFINDKNCREAEKSATNSPIQSTASDVTAMAAWAIMKEGAKVILTVHDSILCLVPQKDKKYWAEHIKATMEKVATELLPNLTWKADVDIMQRWGIKEEE